MSVEIDVPADRFQASERRAEVDGLIAVAAPPAALHAGLRALGWRHGSAILRDVLKVLAALPRERAPDPRPTPPSWDGDE